MIQLVVARPRVHFILLVHSYLFNLLSLSLPGKASPPLFDIKSRLTFAIQIKVTARAWWIWVFPPFSLLLSDQRPISLATITNLTFFHFRRRHINILTIPSQKLMWLVVFIKPFLLCSESFFLILSIDDRLIVGGNAAYWQFAKCIFDTSFMHFPWGCLQTFVAEVELWRVYMGWFEIFFLDHRIE